MHKLWPTWRRAATSSDLLIHLVKVILKKRIVFLPVIQSFSAFVVALIAQFAFIFFIFLNANSSEDGLEIVESLREETFMLASRALSAKINLKFWGQLELMHVGSFGK